MITILQDRNGIIHYIDYSSFSGHLTICDKRFTKIQGKLIGINTLAIGARSNMICAACISAARSYVMGVRKFLYRKPFHPAQNVYSKIFLHNYKYVSVNVYRHKQTIKLLRLKRNWNIK